METILERNKKITVIGKVMIMRNKKIHQYIRTSLLIVFVGTLIIYILLNLFMPKQILKVFGFKPYIVVTKSMEPEINVNDMIIIRDYPIEELEVGDIITFKTDMNHDDKKEVVTHYIYSIVKNNENEYLVRTNKFYDSYEDIKPDHWVLREDDIVGQYIYTIPYIGSIILFFKSPFGLFVIFANLLITTTIVIINKQ